MSEPGIDPKIEALRRHVNEPHIQGAEDHEAELMRRIGQAMPECKFAVRGKVRVLRVPRLATVHHLYRWVGDEKHDFLVTVLEITPQEALTLADQAREFYQKQTREHRQRCDAEEEAEETARRKEVRMSGLKKGAVLAVALAVALLTGLLLVSPAGAATTQVLVTEPPAETLFLGLDQIPSGPIVVSFITNDGFEVTMTVTAPVDAAQFLPMDFFMVAGPRGSIDLSHVPEPGTAAMMGIGLLWLGVLGHRRK